MIALSPPDSLREALPQFAGGAMKMTSGATIRRSLLVFALLSLALLIAMLYVFFVDQSSIRLLQTFNLILTIIYVYDSFNRAFKHPAFFFIPLISF